MSVVVIGVNHRTMPLDLFERMTVDGARLPKALADLAAREHLGEVLVLSTCNRTEVYARAERFHGAYADVRNFLSELAFVAPDEFADHLYVHYDAEAVRHLGAPVIRFSDGTFAELKLIRTFLHQRMYRHWTVQRMRRKARMVVSELFGLFTGAPELMPADWNLCGRLDAGGRARVVADYIAGMTDRFALQEHRKLTDPLVKG